MRLLRWMVTVVLVVATTVACATVFFVYENYWKTLPSVDPLLEYDPPVATRVRDAQGRLVEEFFVEKRYFTPIDRIPAHVRQAFIAAEDADFYSHYGFDALGIVRAAVANARAGDVVQGGSTITQQVVKSLLLSPERSYERKLREILLAIELERRLDKDHILELYLNQIYFGDGNYGVEAAARAYFATSAEQLTVAQAALLAGLPQAPSRYSPTRNLDAAIKRQRYVLEQMLAQGLINSGAYQQAVREEIVIQPKSEPGGLRNYYTEAVRLYLEDNFGKDAPYSSGYDVWTAMDGELQAMAQSAVRHGIENVDGLLGYRGAVAHLEGAEYEQRLAAEQGADPSAPLDPSRRYEGLVTEVGKSTITVALAGRSWEIATGKVSWSRRADHRGFRRGDVLEVSTRQPGKEFDADAEERLWLAPRPEVEAALVAIDVANGRVVAMVGGYDFAGSQFNRAIQAHRQPGSAFKPFIYSAALDNGYTPATVVYDEPVEYMDNGKIWSPQNYSRKYYGPTTVRAALENSRNVVTIKLVDSVGVDRVVNYVSNFGFDARIGRNLSIGLGTTELTPLDLTAAYTVFANGGVKVEPVTILRVQDNAGRVLRETYPQRYPVISPQTAALVTSMLRGVVQRGTGRRAAALGRPAAGKTGTTNDQRDAWFIGFTPEMVVGVWVGFDDHSRSMGRPGTGGTVAAPIWLEFMQQALAARPVKDFEIPDGIRCVNIDPRTGLRASQYTKAPQLECFKAGTEPVDYQPMWIWGDTPDGTAPATGAPTGPDTPPGDGQPQAPPPSPGVFRPFGAAAPADPGQGAPGAARPTEPAQPRQPSGVFRMFPNGAPQAGQPGAPSR